MFLLLWTEVMLTILPDPLNHQEERDGGGSQQVAHQSNSLLVLQWWWPATPPWLRTIIMSSAGRWWECVLIHKQMDQNKVNSQLHTVDPRDASQARLLSHVKWVKSCDVSHHPPLWGCFSDSDRGWKALSAWMPVAPGPGITGQGSRAKIPSVCLIDFQAKLDVFH